MHINLHSYSLHISMRAHVHPIITTQSQYVSPYTLHRLPMAQQLCLYSDSLLQQALTFFAGP